MIRKVDTVSLFIRMLGCADDSRMMYLTYAEISLTTCCLLTTLAWITMNDRYDPSTVEDESGDALSVRLFSYLCLTIGTMVFLFISIRLYHRREYRYMTERSRSFSVPAGCQSHIAAVVTYHAIGSIAYVTVPAVCAMASDTVTAGDPFTYVYLDIIPVPTVNLPMYACKYIAYVLPVLIAFVESCFIPIAFIHYVGVLKCDVRSITSTLREALANNDERTLKEAVVCHQQMLTYFQTIKMVFAKMILLNISFHCIYISIVIIVTLQIIKGHIKYAVLFLCIASSMESLIISTIFCIYGSVVSDLHEEILRALIDNNLFHATKSFKQTCLIMMTRVTKPLEFRVGYIFTINLTFYVRVIKTIYSLINVMLASIKYISFDDGVNADVTLLKEPTTDS